MKIDSMRSFAAGLTVFLAASAFWAAPAHAFSVQVTNSSQDCDVSGVLIVRNGQTVATDSAILRRGESRTIQASDEQKWLCPDTIRVFYKPEQGKCHFIPGEACLDGGAAPCKASCADATFNVIDKKQNNLSAPDVKKQ